MLIPLEKGGRCLHQNEKEGRKSPWGWIGGLGALIVSGLKYIPALLKMGKFGGTFISMAVTVGAYALLYPWSFAIGLVLMIFIHEMGHIWAAKRKGLPVSAPAFIPFLGALIMLKRQPQDAVTEAYVAFGGPLIGTAGAFMTWLLAGWTGYEVLYPIAFIGFFLNLFNLLPMHPLDGGRIVTGHFPLVMGGGTHPGLGFDYRPLESHIVVHLDLVCLSIVAIVFFKEGSVG